MAHSITFGSSLVKLCNDIGYPFFSVQTSGGFLILAMTFDKFYSIIRPHKAAAFNTVKRARITSAIIIVLSFLYNIPHLYVSGVEDTKCSPYGNDILGTFGRIHYWFSVIVNNMFPFCALLVMNTRILHAIRTRVKNHSSVPRINSFHAENNPDNRSHHGNQSNQGNNIEGTQPIKSSDVQISITLLSVTFTFLILITPGYILFFYTMFTDVRATPREYAKFHLFWTVAQKCFFTNNGINFILYVISGQKFRTHFLKLFRFQKKERKVYIYHMSNSNA